MITLFPPMYPEMYSVKNVSAIGLAMYRDRKSAGLPKVIQHHGAVGPLAVSTDDVMAVVQDELDEEQGFIVVHTIAEWMAG